MPSHWEEPRLFLGAGYFSVSNDVCDIAKALGSSPPDYAEAQAIYSKGKNSVSGTGAKRTLKSERCCCCSRHWELVGADWLSGAAACQREGCCARRRQGAQLGGGAPWPPWCRPSRPA